MKSLIDLPLLEYIQAELKKLKIKKYKYSTGQMFFDVMLLSFATLAFYITLITHHSNYKSWLVFCFLFLLILIRLIYLSLMYFIPCLRDKTALELDNDKLQLFIKGKLLFQIPRDVAYWKDIESIDYTSAPRVGGAIISFSMKDGSVFGISTKYIAGNDKEIYNTIIEYFKAHKA